MAETEIGTAMKRNNSRSTVSLVVGVTTYTGFVVSDNSLEPTAAELEQADSNGDTIQRVFYNAGSQLSINTVIKDTSGILAVVPKGSIFEVDSVKYCTTTASTAESAGENARLSLTGIREDSMGAAYDAL